MATGGQQKDTCDVAVIPETLKKKHNILLVKLNENIYPEDEGYKNFLTYLRNAYLPSGPLSAIEKEPRKVFELMEKKTILKVGDYRVLEEALEQSGNHNLLDLVRELGSEITRGIKRQGLKRSATEETAQKYDGYPHKRIKTGKLHERVLDQCLPDLVKDLDIVTVSNYIKQNEVLDDVTIRDISEQKTTTKKVKELIKQIKKKDQDVYEKFKNCLVLAKQPFLKDMLEKKEATLAS